MHSIERNIVKKTKYTRAGIEKLPADKPVIYRIKTRTGKTNYIGSAKCGRVRQRIGEHLGRIPGATVEIEQFSRIKDARERESRAIKYSKPKHNKKGKQFLLIISLCNMYCNKPDSSC